MFAPLSLFIYLSGSAVLAWAVVFVLKDRAVILKQLWAAGVVEALLVLQGIVCAVNLMVTPRPHLETWEFWGYTLTILIVLPGAALWAFAERTRWSSVVLAVAAITVLFLQFRLGQIWG